MFARYKAITALTDAFCKRHLNEEYAQMCRRLTVALAQKQPTPLVRGRAEVWACGIVRTIGWANMLDDPRQSPYMKLIAIDPEFGVAKSTGQAKSMAIRRMFGIGRLNVNWTLPSRLGVNPLVWKVEVNGTLVDIRQESRERQEAAFRKGLIPYIPAPTGRQSWTTKPADPQTRRLIPSKALVRHTLWVPQKGHAPVASGEPARRQVDAKRTVQFLAPQLHQSAVSGCRGRSRLWNRLFSATRRPKPTR